MKQAFIQSSLAIGLLAFASIVPQLAYSQAACNSSGETVGPAAEFGPATYAIGDLTVVDGGANPADINDADWYLAGSAAVDLYAALEIPAGTIVRLKAGAVLNVYGNVTNNGYLFVEPGATINFYGNTWTNGSTAVVGDGAAIANTTPGGAVNFIASRPAIPASVSATACVMSNYSGGNFAQSIDGGNVPMDIALHIQNANNINLINTDTRIEGTVVFDVVDGDVNLGNNDFLFTTNGTWTTNVAPNAAYFLTNGTTACAGAVEKEGLAPNASFVFPIGRAETYSGGRDFTPAILQNDGATTDNFQVRVKNYADAASIGGVVIHVSAEGMDRIWQITSTNGSGVTIGLQHNSSTNGADYTTVFGGDPNAFITQYQGAGAWSSALPPGVITGSVGGSVIHTQGFSLSTTATNCNDAGSWFTKSPDQASPLPVVLLSFTGTAASCTANLSWTVASEQSFSHFELEYATDAINFRKVGEVEGNNQSVYSFKHAQASGEGFYKLKMVDRNGSSSYSSVVKVVTDCGQNQLEVYPNPAQNNLNVKGIAEGSKVYVINAIGQVVIMQQVVMGATSLVLDVSYLSNGVYNVVVEHEGLRQVVKVVKKD